MTVSVIMAVYNGEQYLKAMLDSLLFQMRKPNEIICVDDGSTDGSLKLLQGYAEKYPFIKVYSVENGGAAAARCYGFAHSTGEAVCFVDCDDTVDPDYLSSLHDALTENEADVAVGGYAREKEDGSLICCEMMKKQGDIMPSYEEALWINTALWNKMIRRRCILDITLPRIRQGDDLVYWCSILPQVQRITFVPKPMYHYIQHSGSQMAAFSEESFQLMCEEFFKSTKELAGNPVFDTVVGCYFISLCVAQLPRYYQMDRQKAKQTAQDLLTQMDAQLPGWRKVQALKFSTGWRTRFKGLAFWCCGVMFRWRIYPLYMWGMNLLKKCGLRIGW